MKYSSEEPRFVGSELDEDVNIPDLLKSLEKDNVIALIDEEKGGIVAYVLRGNDHLFNRLNYTALVEQEGFIKWPE